MLAVRDAAHRAPSSYDVGRDQELADRPSERSVAMSGGRGTEIAERRPARPLDAGTGDALAGCCRPSMGAPGRTAASSCRPRTRLQRACRRSPASLAQEVNIGPPLEDRGVGAAELASSSCPQRQQDRRGRGPPAPESRLQGRRPSPAAQWGGDGVEMARGGGRLDPRASWCAPPGPSISTTARPRWRTAPRLHGIGRRPRAVAHRRIFSCLPCTARASGSVVAKGSSP